MIRGENAWARATTSLSKTTMIEVLRARMHHVAQLLRRCLLTQLSRRVVLLRDPQFVICGLISNLPRALNLCVGAKPNWAKRQRPVRPTITGFDPA